jgi:hypothetical protein
MELFWLHSWLLAHVELLMVAPFLLGRTASLKARRFLFLTHESVRSDRCQIDFLPYCRFGVASFLIGAKSISACTELYPSNESFGGSSFRTIALK